MFFKETEVVIYELSKTLRRTIKSSILFKAMCLSEKCLQLNYLKVLVPLYCMAPKVALPELVWEIWLCNSWILARSPLTAKEQPVGIPML